MGLAMAFRMAWRPALGLGLLLSQGGEFGFVLFAQAQSALLIEPEAASLFGAIVTLSMATTPFLMMATRRLAPTPVVEGGARRAGRRRLERARRRLWPLRPDRRADADGAGHHRHPDRHRHRDDRRRRQLRRQGLLWRRHAARLLRQAGAAEAELILFCIDGDQIEPEFVEARARGLPEGGDLRPRLRPARLAEAEGRAGRRHRSARCSNSAVRMARMAMESVGVDVEEIDRAEELYRARDRERLKARSRRATCAPRSTGSSPSPSRRPRPSRARRRGTRWPMPRVRTSAPSFLSCRHPRREPRPARRRSPSAARPTSRCATTRSEVPGRAEAALDREAEGHRHADRHRLAVRQPGLRLDRMAEAVAEIEQGALARSCRARRPATNAVLACTQVSIAWSRAASSPASRAAPFASHQAKKSASPIRPYLTTSA